MKRMKRPHRKTEPEEEGPMPPPGWGMIALWGAMFLLVVMVIFNIVPISQGISPLRSRKEKKLMQSAGVLEDEKNWSSATSIYSELLEDSRASSKVRVEAALRLHEIYKSHLSSPGLALDAIRDAYLLERDNARHASLKEQWRQYASSVGTLDRPFAIPAGTTVIAEIGGDQVTLEEVLLAWQRQNPGTQLTPEAMSKFVQDYMTNALLAEGARLRGQAKNPTYLLDMRNLERGSLSREIQISLSKPADRAVVEAYYKEHQDRFVSPDSVAMQHIVVRGEDQVTSISQRLAAGEDFLAIAKSSSLDKDTLVNGSELGWMSLEDDFITNVGIVPGLARKMALKDDGYTTGPIQTQRGSHWFRLQQKKVKQPYPLDEIYARVEKEQRKAAFDSARQALLDELKKTIPVTMHDDKLKAAVEKLNRAQKPGSASAEPPVPMVGPAPPSGAAP